MNAAAAAAAVAVRILCYPLAIDSRKIRNALSLPRLIGTKYYSGTLLRHDSKSFFRSGVCRFKLLICSAKVYRFCFSTKLLVEFELKNEDKQNVGFRLQSVPLRSRKDKKTRNLFNYFDFWAVTQTAKNSQCIAVYCLNRSCTNDQYYEINVRPNDSFYTYFLIK